MILLGLWLEAFVSVLRLKALLFPFMQGRRGGGYLGQFLLVMMQLAS